MNKTYRIVWNETTNTWVAVAEIAKAHGKSASVGGGIVASCTQVGARFAFTAAASAVLMMGAPAMAANGTEYQANTDNLCYYDTTTQSVICGDATTSATNTGNQPKSVVMGVGATSTGETNVAIGASSSANSTGAIAIGGSAKASDNQAIAIGLNAEAAADWDISIGRQAGFGTVTPAGEGRNIAIGDGALRYATAPNNNIAMGTSTGGRLSGARNVLLGTYVGNHNAVQSAMQALSGKSFDSLTDAEKATYATQLGVKLDTTSNTYYVATNDTVALGHRALATKAADVAIGQQAKATGGTSVAVGNGSYASQANAVAVGREAKAVGSNSIAQGTYAHAGASGAIPLGIRANATDATTTKTTGANSIAIGIDTNASTNHSVAIGTNAMVVSIAGQTPSTGSVALGASSKVTHVNSVAIGNISEAAGQNTFAGGNDSHAIGTSAVAIGDGAGKGDRNITAGTGNYASGASSTAVGAYTKAAGEGSTALGLSADAQSYRSVAAGAFSVASANSTVAIGDTAKAINNAGAVAIGKESLASGTSSVALGTSATSSMQSTVAVGNLANAAADNAVAIGIQANATGSGNVAIGANAGKKHSTTAQGSNTVLIGVDAGAEAANNQGQVSVGWQAGQGTLQAFNAAVGHQAGQFVNGTNNVAFGKGAGSGTSATDRLSINDTVAIGTGAKATADNAIAIGKGAEANAINTISIGTGNVVSGEGSGAIGDPSTVTGTDSYSLGNDNTVATNNTFVIGNNVTQTLDNSVILGDSSSASGINKGYYTLNGTQDTNVVGVNDVVGVVSAGTAGQTRQIQNVAAGVVSSTSTDAINGSQLYAVAKELKDGQTHYYSVNAGSARVTTDPTNVDNLNATGGHSMAAGENASASGDSSTAIGYNANAANIAAVALGWETQATGDHSMALGGSSQGATGSVKTTAAGWSSMAIGFGAQTDEDATLGVAFGDLAHVQATATKTTRAATAIGREAVVGAGANSAIAFGTTAEVSEDAASAIAMGDTAKALKTNATALGAFTTATNEGDVALGAHSVSGTAVTTNSATVNGVTYSGFAGNSPTSVVSVGQSGQERQIQNVAAGQITATSTDAINGSQLYQVANQLASSLTHYYSVNDNGVQGNNYNNDGATADGALAAGVGASATAYRAVAVGKEAAATNIEAVAIGTKAAASNTATVAISENAKASGTSSIAIGLNTEASGNNSFVMGSGSTLTTANRIAKASGNQSVAIGYQTQALGLGGTAIGSNATAAEVNYATAIGSNATAVAATSLAVGSSATAKGISSVAIGRASTTYTGNDIAIGSDAQAGVTTAGASSSNSIAIGRGTQATKAQAVAIGNGAQVTVDHGVALGSNSVASVDKGAIGTDPLGAATSTTNSTWKATHAAVSVGNGTTVTRQITSVAAGTQDTDAVNVAQLKAAGFTLAATASDGELGGSVPDDKIQNGETVTVDAGKNIKVTHTANQVSIATKDDVEFTTVTTTDTAGNQTVLNGTGITITPTGGTNPVSLTNTGLNNGGNTITNVAAGTNDTDAVNVGQLKTQTAAAKTEVTGTGLATVSKTSGTNGQDIYNVDVATAAAPTVTRGSVTVAAADAGKVMTAGDVANAITASERTSSVVAGSNALTAVAGTEDANGNTEYTVDLSQASKDSLAKADTALQKVVSSDANLTATQNGDTVTLDFSDTPTFTSVTTGNTTINNDGITIANGTNPVSLTNTGLNNGGNTITNVAAGTNDTDAVNVGQLKTQTAAAKTEVTGTGLATVSKTSGTNGQDIYNVDVATAAAPTVTRGSVTVAAADAGKVMTAGDVANAITASERTSSVVAGSNALTAVAGTEDANGNTEYTVDLSQASKDSLAKADTALQKVVSSDANLTATQNGDTVTLDFSDTPTFTSVTTGNTTINNDGITIANGTNPVSLTNTGLNNGGNTITNVAAGTNDTDAVNVGQLKTQTAAAKTEVTGTGLATVSKTSGTNGQDIYNVDVATAAAPTVTRGSVTVAAADAGKVMTAGDVANAITASERTSSVVAGSNALTAVAGTEDANGNTEYTVNLSQASKDSLAKADTALQKVVSSDANLTATQNGDTVTLDFSDTPTFTSVTTGNTTINNDGITIANGTNPVSLTNTGLNNGGNTITNVAAGTNDTDAVNVGQLKTQTAAAKTEVTGTGLATVSKTSGTNGQDIYNVDVATAAAPTVTRGSVTVAAADAGKVMTAGDVANAITASERTSSVVAGSNALTAVAGTEDANGNTEYTVNLSQASKDSLAKADTALQKVVSSDANLTATQNGDTVTLDFSDTPTFTSVTTGNTTINNDGITIANGTNPVSLTNTGLNNGGNTITNVAAGTNDTDAVNVGQLKTQTAAAKTEVTGTGLATVSKTSGTNGQDIYNVDVATAAAPTVTRGSVTVAAADAGKVMTAGDVANAITASERTSSVVAGSNALTAVAGTEDANGNTEYTVDLSQASKDSLAKADTALQKVVSSDANLTATQNGDTVTLDFSDTPTFTSVTTGNTTINNDGITIANGTNPVSLTNTGLNNGGNTITNVAAGTNDTDAVNVGQLKTQTAAAKTEVTGTGLATVSKTSGTNGQDIYNVDVATAAAPTVTRGSVTVAAADAGKVMTAGDVANAITASERTSSVVAGSNALTAVAGTEDANGNTEYTVHLSQASKDSLAKADTALQKVVSSDANLTATQNGDTVTLDFSDTPTFTSVTTGNTTINNDGITIANGTNPVSLTNTGLNNGGNTITNVAAGTNDTDAVNVGQLKTQTAAAKTEVTGTGLATVSKTSGTNGQDIYNVDVATAAAPTVTRGSVTVAAADAGKVMTAGDVANAITASERTSSVVAGSNALTAVAGTEDANGNTEYTVDLSQASKDSLAKADTALQKVVSSDANLTATQNGDTVTLDFSDTPTFTSVTTGNTTINNDGITIANGTNPVSLTNTGLNNGGNTITNVAAGTNDTDAVNVGQLKTQTAAAKTEVTGTGLATVSKTSGTNGQDIYNVDVATAAAPTVTRGSVTVAAADAGKVMTAGDVANAITASERTSSVVAGSNALTAVAGTEDANGNTEYTVDLSQASKDSLAKADTALQKVVSSDANLTATQNGDTVTLDFSDTPTFTSVTTGNTTINNDGITIANGTNPVSLTNTGLNNGGNTITGVAAGTNDTDAVNVGQLKGAVDVLGGGAAINTDGTIKAPTYNITNPANGAVTTANNVDDALSSLNDAVNSPLTFKGDSGEFNRNLGQTTTVKGGITDTAKLSDNNIGVVAKDGTLDIKLAKDIAVDSVKTGDTTVNTYGVSIANVDPNKVVSLTASGLNNGNNRITNVAAGQAGTDAVNKDQLDAAKAAATTKVAAGKNVKVAEQSNGDGSTTYTVATADEVDFTKATVGNVTIDSASNKISGLANGDVSATSTDAINGSQLFATNQNVANNATKIADNAAQIAKGINVGGTTGSNNYALGDTINVKGDNNISSETVAGGVQLKLNDVVNIGTAKPVQIDGTAGTVGGLSNTAWDANNIVSGQAATEDQLKSAVSAAQAAATTKVVEGKNVKVTEQSNADGSTTYTVATADDVNFNSITAGTGANQVVLGDDGVKVGGNTYISDVGLNANDKKITNVAKGNVTSTSKDAINGSQLYGTANSVATALGGGATVQADGTVSAPTYNITNPANGAVTTANNVGDALKGLNDAVNSPLTFAGDSGKNVERKLGTTLGIKGGVTDTAKLSQNNIGVVSNGTDTLEIQLAKELAGLTSVSTGNTVMNNDGVTITGGANKPVSLTNAGLDNGGNKVTNVAAGTETTDAVNKGQLDAAQAAASNKVKAGDNIEVAESKNADGSTTYTVATAKDVNFNSVTAGSGANQVVLGNDGVKVGGNTYISNAGLNANDKKIINVANGDVSANSKDAINGSQLFAQGEGVKNIIGGNTTYDPATGTYTNNNIGGTGKGNINDAIQAINTAATQAKSTVTAGDNIVVTPSQNADGSTNYTVATAKDLTVDSIKAGDTTINNAGVTVGDKVALTNTGLTAGDVKVSTDGINAGNKIITGVASGLNGKTLDQIKADPNAAERTNAASIGDLAEVQSDVTNITNNVTNITNNVLNGNTKDANGNTVTYVDENGNLTDAGKVALTTYNVSGQTEFVHNSVISAIQQMNNEGIKYFHTNDGQTPVAENTNSQDSSASGKYASAVGYQTSSSGENATAMGSSLTVTTDSQTAGATITEVTENGQTVLKQRTTASGARAVALGAGSQALGADSIAIGTGNVVSGQGSGAIGDPTVVTGNSAYSIGNNNTVSANNAYALGSNITANVADSVYLGDRTTTSGVHIANPANGSTYTYGGLNDANVAGVTGSTAPANNVVGVVAVGNNADEVRQIQGVAAGVVSPTSTDAINGSQLYDTHQAIGNVANYTVNMGNQLNQRIDGVEKRSNAGTAAAMAVAGLPQAYLPGKSMMAVSGSTYRGESGYAVGFSSISDNGNWIIKGSATGNSRGHYGATAGVGYQW